MKKQVSPEIAKDIGIAQRRFQCDNQNYFGETLKELRLEKNMKQAEAAGVIGITPGQWSFYENGRSIPNLDIFLLIAEKFNINPLAFLGKTFDKSYYGNGLELSFKEYDEAINKGINAFVEPQRDKKAKEVMKQMGQFLGRKKNENMFVR